MRCAVLAGGTASRFAGLPKGLQTVGDQRLLDRVVSVLRQATGELPVLIANDPAAATWRSDLLVRPDTIPGAASLGGIYTAITAGDGPVLVAAWDMPFISVPLARALIDGAGSWDVYLPESDGPQRMEPLCAVYAPGCRSAIRRCIEAGELKTTAFHDRVRVGLLPLSEVTSLGDPDTLFFNVNAPEDLDAARALDRTLSPDGLTRKS